MITNKTFTSFLQTFAVIFFSNHLISFFIIDPDLYNVNYLITIYFKWKASTFWNPKKSFVLYAFISKNRHKQDSKETFLFCIFFPSCFAILQFSKFHISRLHNTCIQVHKCLYTTLSVDSKKQRYTHQRCAWISPVSESQQF